MRQRMSIVRRGEFVVERWRSLFAKVRRGVFGELLVASFRLFVELFIVAPSECSP